MCKAFFAAGCFWSVEEAFWKLPGVTNTSVGYMGGTVPDPTYEQVCTGTTGHAETVLVEYDETKIDYLSLLTTFWEKHNPTEGLKQGNDIGSQYRSVIFTTNDQQFAQANMSRQVYQTALTSNNYGAITTEIIPVVAEVTTTFYLAETYHQKYLLKNPHGYRCFSATGISYPIGE